MESNFSQNLNLLKNLPSTWEVKSLSQVIDDVSGGNKKLLKSKFQTEGKFAIIDQGKDLIAGFYNDEAFKVKSEPPYIVFGDHTRVLKCIDFPFIMGADGIKVLQAKDKNNNKYLYYFLSTLEIPNTGYNRHFKYLKEIKIPLPPLATQKKIAATLDAADNYRQLTKKLIAHYETLTQSLFLDMFGDVKKNPNNFPRTCLNDICSKITDGEHGTVKRVDRGKLYLMARNIRDNFIDLSDVSYISEQNHQRIYKRCKAEKGDILLVCVGATIGRLCIMPEMEEFSLARSVALLKPRKEKVTSYFLYSALSSNYIQEVIKRSGNSSAQAGLYTGKIKELEIYLPPLALQTQFADRVQAIETQKAQAQASLVKAEELFSSLLQKAFSGGLV